MKPKMMEMVQTSQDALPTVAAIPPIENSTSAGTPLATQNAPVQSIFRCRLCAAPAAVSGTFAAVAVLMAPPKLSRNDDLTSQPSARKAAVQMLFAHSTPWPKVV